MSGNISNESLFSVYMIYFLMTHLDWCGFLLWFLFSSMNYILGVLGLFPIFPYVFLYISFQLGRLLRRQLDLR